MLFAQTAPIYTPPPVIFKTGSTTLVVDPANTTASILQGIRSAYSSGVGKVVIPPGTYRLACPSGSNWHIYLASLKNFEIDATGVTFIALDRTKRLMLLEDCDTLILRGLTFIREVPSFSQGKIQSISTDRTSVEIAIDAGYPTDIDDTQYFQVPPVISIYQPGTRHLKGGVPDLYIQGIQRITANLFRFQFRNPVHASIPLAVGDSTAWRSASGSDCAIWTSTRVHLEDVTIKNSARIGFMELGGMGNNRYIRCQLTYGPTPPNATEQPLLACSLDGLHSGSVRKGPIVEDCLFEGLNDDAVNIHGSYAMSMQGPGNKVVVDWRAPHSSHGVPMAFGKARDLIRFYTPAGQVCAEARLLSLRPMPTYDPGTLGTLNSRVFSDRSKAVYVELTLDAVVGAQRTGVVANTATTGSGFAIRRSTFRDNRGHGIFIRAGEGVIEDCTLERSLMGSIIIAPELNSWNESDYSRKVIIRNNRIRDVGVATQPWNGAITVAAYEYGGFVPLPGGHRAIQITGNTISDTRGPNLVITSAIGVTVSGNHFERPMHQPPFKIESIGVSNPYALVWMRHAADVTFTGNTVSSPGSQMGTLVDQDSTVTASGLPTGLTITNP